MQIGILEKKDFPPKALNELRKIGEVEFFNGDNLKKFIEDKEIIFVRLKYFIGKEILKRAEKLKFICTPTTGLNHLDLKEIKKRNITILSLKGENKFLSKIRATPEHTLGLLIALLRNYKSAFLNNNNKVWDRDKFKGYELFEKKVGLIGFGRIGKILAKYLLAIGAKVFFYDVDNKIKPRYGAVKVNDLISLIKKCDILVLCASFTDENKKFFNKKYIDLLKNKYFINTARGELVDEEYLIKKIKENYFKGVALDVISNETGKNNLNRFIRLSKNRNFILTPHIGGATFESMRKAEEFLVEKLKKKILKYYDGKTAKR